MKLVALMPMRHESWCIGCTVRAALRWCDAIVVLEHQPDEASSTILDQIANETPERLVRLTERSPEWNEANYRSRLLDAGRAIGGTHFATLDADEIVTGNLMSPLREAAQGMASGRCLWLPWLCLWRSLDKYRSDDTTFGSARAPLLFADDGCMKHEPKENGYQIHTRMPTGIELVVWKRRDEGGIMHLQHVEWRRLLAKHALYKMTEKLRWPWRDTSEVERLYNMSSDERDMRLIDTPPSWWAPYLDLKKLLRLNQEPWQEPAAKALMREYGDRGTFRGLNLFGVA